MQHRTPRWTPSRACRMLTIAVHFWFALFTFTIAFFTHSRRCAARVLARRRCTPLLTVRHCGFSHSRHWLRIAGHRTAHAHARTVHRARSPATAVSFSRLSPHLLTISTPRSPDLYLLRCLYGRTLTFLLDGGLPHAPSFGSCLTTAHTLRSCTLLVCLCDCSRRHLFYRLPHQVLRRAWFLAFITLLLYAFGSLAAVHTRTLHISRRARRAPPFIFGLTYNMTLALALLHSHPSAHSAHCLLVAGIFRCYSFALDGSLFSSRFTLSAPCFFVYCCRLHASAAPAYNTLTAWVSRNCTDSPRSLHRLPLTLWFHLLSSYPLVLCHTPRCYRVCSRFAFYRTHSLPSTTTFFAAHSFSCAARVWLPHAPRLPVAFSTPLTAHFSAMAFLCTFLHTHCATSSSLVSRRSSFCRARTVCTHLCRSARYCGCGSLAARCAAVRSSTPRGTRAPAPRALLPLLSLLTPWTSRHALSLCRLFSPRFVARHLTARTHSHRAPARITHGMHRLCNCLWDVFVPTRWTYHLAATHLVSARLHSPHAALTHCVYLPLRSRHCTRWDGTPQHISASLPGTFRSSLLPFVSLRGSSGTRLTLLSRTRTLHAIPAAFPPHRLHSVYAGWVYRGSPFFHVRCRNASHLCACLTRYLSCHLLRVHGLPFTLVHLLSFLRSTGFCHLFLDLMFLPVADACRFTTVDSFCGFILYTPQDTHRAFLRAGSYFRVPHRTHCLLLPPLCCAAGAPRVHAYWEPPLTSDARPRRTPHSSALRTPRTALMPAHRTLAVYKHSYAAATAARSSRTGLRVACGLSRDILIFYHAYWTLRTSCTLQVLAPPLLFTFSAGFCTKGFLFHS